MPRKPIEGPVVLDLHITLADTDPPVWRRVLVPEDFTLLHLHEVIQSAFGWLDYHLHEFATRKTRFLTDFGDQGFWDPVDPNAPHEAEVTLGEVFSGKNRRLGYTYDFGDGWRHVIQRKGRLAAVPGQRYPVVTDGARACPPEDCGGPWRYSLLLEAHKNGPQDEFECELLELVGPRFDPEAFSVEQANRRLKKLARVLVRKGGKSSGKAAARKPPAGRRRSISGNWPESMPSNAKLMSEVRAFELSSLMGMHHQGLSDPGYRPGMPTPMSEAWRSKVADLLKACTAASHRQPDEYLHETYESLFSLLDRLDAGCDTVILVDQEPGPHLIDVDWEDTLKQWLRCAAMTVPWDDKYERLAVRRIAAYGPEWKKSLAAWAVEAREETLLAWAAEARRKADDGR